MTKTKRKFSVSSEDSEFEDDTIRMLRCEGVSNERIKNIKSRIKRIRCREFIEASPFGEFCASCGVVSIQEIRDGWNISDTFERLSASSNSCQLCLLVLMSLRNKLPEIDAKLGNHGPVTGRVAVAFDENGGTDIEGMSRGNGWRFDVTPGPSLQESFRLSTGSEADGVIMVEANVAHISNSRHGNIRGLLHVNSFIRIYTKSAKVSTSLSLPLDPRPRGNQKFDLMRKWLAEENIPTEVTISTTASTSIAKLLDNFPSRLIWVPGPASADTCLLKLVESKDLLKNDSGEKRSYPSYITLSHRWGSTHNFTTTKANLLSRQSGFELQDLPSTYRDAAIVAAKLGFNYLWIDAVCILQDDSVEWLQESERMGIIYRHAACTIASHCSQDDNGGFLEAALQKRGSVKFCSRKLDQTFVRSAAHLDFDITKSPLSRRGWILQERLLSTRILHFTTGMIYLETARGTRSEDGETPTALIQPILDSITLLTVDQFFYRKPVNLQSFAQFLPHATFQEHLPRTMSTTTYQSSPLSWFSLIEMYSTCTLTKPEDKLPAISGISKICSHLTNSLYLSGIWADLLPIGLMFLNVGHPLSKPSISRAPSWSWATYDGPLQFVLSNHTVPYHSSCKFLHASPNRNQLTIEIDMLDLSLEMSSGELFISVTREEICAQSLRAWDSDTNALWRIDGSDPPIRLFNIFNAHRFLWTGEVPYRRDERSWIVFDSEGGKLKLGKELFCVSMALFVAVAPKDRAGEQGVLLHFVLFLERGEGGEGEEGEEGPVYRRVGAGMVRHTFLENLRVSRKGSSEFERKKIVLV